MRYEAVIGLEVHAQLLTEAKIFCSCPTEFAAKANSQTCSGCLGLPGSLPILNKQCIDLAIKLGLALGSQINNNSYFERKHYFYPDLPAGFQTTQNIKPIILGGTVEIELEDGTKKNIQLHHAHLEEDAGRLIHEQNVSLVDLNRSGQGLLEIVTEPVLQNANEAVAYVKALREILIYLNINDGNLEEGSMRCDVNISLRPIGSQELGVRAEIKNINSFRSMQRAIEYEIRRHTAALDEGSPLVQETRLFNDNDGSTYSMRSKETAADYRYLQETNIPPIAISQSDIERVKKTIPELAYEKDYATQSEFQLSKHDTEILTQDPSLAQYFEQAVEGLQDNKTIKNIVNWIFTELLRELGNNNKKAHKSPIKPKQLVKLVLLLEEGKLSGPLAKDVFAKMYETSKDAETIMAEENIEIVSDEGTLIKMVEEIIKNNPAQVEQYKNGNQKIIGYFVGQVLKATSGQGDPKKANSIIKKILDN